MGPDGEPAESTNRHENMGLKEDIWTGMEEPTASVEDRVKTTSGYLLK